MGTYFRVVKSNMRVLINVDDNEEFLSDSYKYETIDDYNGTLIKMKSKWIVKSTDVDVDIGCGNAFGDNEEEQGGNNDKEKVLELEESFKLVEQAFSKKDFGSWFKK